MNTARILTACHANRGRRYTGLLLFLLATVSGTNCASAGTDADAQPITYLCQFCPIPLGWRGVVDAGPAVLSGSDPRFADYRGLDRKGFYANISGEVHFLDRDGHYLDSWVRNLGLDNRQIQMRGGRQGDYTFHLDWREIPHRLGYSTLTPFSGAGSGNLSLPDRWMGAATTGGMPGLDASLQPAALSVQRRMLDAGIDLRLSSRWSMDADVNHTEKHGTRAFGAGVFTLNASHFPAPVDFSTDRVSANLSYLGDTTHVRVGLAGSWFENRIESVTWQNPFVAIPGTENLRASLAPDNQAWMLSVAGAGTFSSKYRWSGLASVGRLWQDEPFLPYSINPDYSDLPLPRASLDGHINTAKFRGRLTARVGQHFEWVASAQLDRRDNHSPVNAYTPVITDLVLRPPTLSRPYSLERRNAELEGRYRLSSGTRLRGGIRHRSVQRTLQAVDETRETAWWGSADFNLSSRLDARVRLETASRDASPYAAVIDPGLIENSLMRKFYLADRKRDRLVAELDFSPLQNLSLTASYDRSHDRYRDSQLGLQNGQDAIWTIDASAFFSERLTAYAYYSQEHAKARIAGAIFEGAAPWHAQTRDHFTTLGAGLNGQISTRWNYRLDAYWSRATGNIRTFDDGQQPAFPALVNDLHNLQFQLDFEASRRWHWLLLAERETFDSNDWQVDAAGLTGIDDILTLGAVSPDGSITVVSILARFQF